MKPFRNLRHLIDDQDYTQAELAKAINMGTSTLCDRMNGKHPFDAWQMQRIGAVLHIEPEQYINYFFPVQKREAVNL